MASARADKMERNVKGLLRHRKWRAAKIKEG